MMGIGCLYGWIGLCSLYVFFLSIGMVLVLLILV